MYAAALLCSSHIQSRTRPGNGEAHSGGFSHVKYHNGDNPHSHAQRPMAYVILDSVELTVNSNQHGGSPKITKITYKRSDSKKEMISL